jgi:hypothetical protein
VYGSRAGHGCIRQGLFNTCRDECGEGHGRSAPGCAGTCAAGTGTRCSRSMCAIVVLPLSALGAAAVTASHAGSDSIPWGLLTHVTGATTYTVCACAGVCICFCMQPMPGCSALHVQGSPPGVPPCLVACLPTCACCQTRWHGGGGAQA